MSKKQDDFKKLQATWYKKLEKAGFEDIEQDEHRLKQWDSHYFITRFVDKTVTSKHKSTSTENSTNRFNAHQEYYQLAGAFLHEYEFKDSLERLIWKLHSEGTPTIRIYQKLLASKKNVTRSLVIQTVKRLSELLVQKCQYKKP